MIEFVSPAPAPGCSPVACKAPMSAQQAADVTAVFKVLADPIRLRIASIVACCPTGEICVGDIAAEFDVSGPTVSHHLRLREAGVLVSERRATEVYYRLLPGRLDAVYAELGALGMATGKVRQSATLLV